MHTRLNREKAQHILQPVIGLAASAISFYLALRNISLGEVLSGLARLDLFIGCLALTSVALNTLAKIYRWQVLLGPAGKSISLSKISKVILAGQALNTLSPFRIGDLTRVVAVGRLGVGYFYTLGTVLVEKVLDTIAYTLLFAMLVVQIPLPAWLRQPGFSFLITVFAAACAVFLLAYRQKWFLAWIDKLAGRLPSGKWLTNLGRVREAILATEALRSRESLARLTFWTAVTWGTAILNIWLVMEALQIRLPWTASLVLMIVLQAGITIPSMPGRIGVFEYISVLALAIFGVDQATAFGFGVVLHAIVLLPTTLLGILFLWTLGFDGKIRSRMNVNEIPQGAGSGVEKL